MRIIGMNLLHANCNQTVVTHRLKGFFQALVLALLLTPLGATAMTTNKTLNQAIERYYAGESEQAIELIRPLALSGDVEAQMLLGNLVYSLSQAGLDTHGEDPVVWYLLAAEQNSVDAAYALGALFHNRWLESKTAEDAAQAIVYYQQAVDLGSPKAFQPQQRLQFKSELDLKQAEDVVEQMAEKPALTLAPVSDSTTDVADSSTSESVPEPIVMTETEAEPPAPVESEPEAVQTESEPAPAAATDEKEVTEPEEAEPAPTVTLAEVVDACRIYTETGFRLFVDSIAGATLVGQATLQSTTADGDNYRAAWIHPAKDLAIEIEMTEVPNAAARAMKKDQKSDISGSVIDGQATGANCAVRIRYPSTT